MTYGMPADVAPAAFGRRETLIGVHIAAFIAILDGTPAAAAMVIVTHGVAGIYWVGTVPEARGRGGELCTRAATNTGCDLGVVGGPEPRPTTGGRDRSIGRRSPAG